jgi:hypothetical protein
MLSRTISRMLVVCGVLMMLFGVSALPVQGAELDQAAAQPLLQPSPRPTLAPPSRSHDGSKSGAGMGRITGTIIDLNTGAPMPGIQVNIGGVVVNSDANGNYDLWVAAGPYSVALVLDPARGTPAQGQQMVNVGSGATVVLHLSFRGPQAATATPVTTKNVPAVPAASGAPLANRAGGSAARPHASPRLPRTAEQPNNAWLWMTFGALLLMGGVALEFGRLRRAPQLAGATAAPRPASGYENARLLAALLTGSAREAQPARRAESDILLAALLTADAGEDGPGRQG